MKTMSNKKMHFENRFILFRKQHGEWWFRIFNLGLKYRNLNKVKPMFSERGNLDRQFKFKNIRIKVLK